MSNKPHHNSEVIKAWQMAKLSNSTLKALRVGRTLVMITI